MSTGTITSVELGSPTTGRSWTANEGFSLSANICSVLGFIFTLIVLVKVKRIQQDYLAQARLPDLQKKIRGHRSTLSKLLNQTDLAALRHEIDAEMQKCDANLKNLIPKLSPKQALSVSSLVTKIGAILNAKTVCDREQVRAIYLGLVGIEEELDNLGEDMKWRPRE